ncbi:phosphotransferase family protein [Microlunatus parietis]|uniref:Aminoglycoside phosphotransferase (APT) family kinase protein n=1 Tax=Microlunatus parietis TaxID=682979 RepID=A0A7Y9I9N4_9ACTN|nr:aminoglycoside phosphotransferase family protein [Microlunatus parietis]NYE72830.1 aminoglycoside phosphotransferase (APT) family kinase protein [Microlunatus parietis]
MSFAQPTPHGYELEPELHRTLRGRPPAAVLNWLLDQLGATKIVEVEALPGGTSSAVHKVLLGSRNGTMLPVILRRYVLDWLAEEPWTPGNEAHVLGLLADSPVAAPRLLAADLDGAVSGAPTVVMSWLPGRVDWRPRDLESWLRRLAEALPTIHAVPVDGRLRGFAPYPPERPLPPSWSRHPDAWRRAVELFEGPQPDVPQVFLHRDYHPGNVLWSQDHVSGIVDWPSACVGAAEADVGHCRANLARQFDLDVADRFLGLWQTVSGTADYHPYWDLTDVISWTGSDVEPDPALDAFVAAAAGRL